MLETQNLKLKKPEDNDILDPSLSINPNMDIIDNEIGKIKEGIENISSDAAGTSYDNTNSKLISNTVQGAIDEVNTKSEQNKTSISSLEKKTDDINVKVDAGQRHKLTGDTGFPLDISNGDANTITTCCTRSGSNIAHMPNDNKDWWTIKSDMQGDYGYQKAISWHENKTFQRWKRANVWEEWGSL
jgi:hypothetical protein